MLLLWRWVVVLFVVLVALDRRICKPGVFLPHNSSSNGVLRS